jgi:hypothetical protein
MTLNITWIARALLLGSLLLTPAAARAATPGVEHGRMMISAERLFGLSFSHTSVDTGNGSVDTDVTHFGLAVAPNTPNDNIYTTPRLAFDYAIIDGLTLGGALGVAVTDLSTSVTNNDNTTERSGPTLTTFLVAPRLGYVLSVSHLVGIWLRGGFTYFRAATDVSDNTTRTLWGFGLNIEPTLLLSPWEHVAFTLGLLVDLPLAGKLSTEVTAGNVTNTTSVDASVRNIALAAGLLVSF